MDKAPETGPGRVEVTKGKREDEARDGICRWLQLFLSDYEIQTTELELRRVSLQGRPEVMTRSNTPRRQTRGDVIVGIASSPYTVHTLRRPHQELGPSLDNNLILSII